MIYALCVCWTPPGMLMKNGMVCFGIVPVLLVCAARGCYIVIRLLSRRLHRKEPEFYTLSITVDGKTVSVPALLDTGNALHDPLSDLPVLIAEYAAMHVLFPKELRSFFKKGVKDALPQLHGTGWESRFRMIPYGGLNGKGGLLPAFRPDNVAIPCEGRIIKTGDVFVAVCSGRLCSDGRYRALLTPELFRKVLGDDSFDNTPSVPKDHAFLHGSIK
ncbi:MAG TPA: hypothetical protein DEP42_01105 [Ruminococcaceae bacterium]|nr:hypothetical protein [Oscillospiraceae bacterium]